MADGTQSKCRAVCLISGSGTNLQAIIENINNKSLNIDLISVISDNPMAKGIQRAEKEGICLLYTSPSPRDAHESRMPSSA